LRNTAWDQQRDQEKGNIKGFFGLKPGHYGLLVSEPVAQNILPPLLCLPLLLSYEKKSMLSSAFEVKNVYFANAKLKAVNV